MGVEAIALADFVHGDIVAVEGKLCRHRGGELISAQIAADLERVNPPLVRIRMAQTDRPVVSGKGQDDGQAQPSSVSPVGRASLPPMSPTLKAGVIKQRKADT